MDVRENDKKNIRASLKSWWDKSTKDDAAIDTLLDGSTTIDGYTFAVTSGHRAFINAIKDGIQLTIIDCGAPDDPAEFKSTLKTKLNELKGGNRRSRQTKKRRKLRKRTSKKNYKKTRRY